MSKIYIISGPSGVGKGSIIDALIGDSKLNLHWVKTVTTRSKRSDDEKFGRHIFVDNEEFKEMIQNNQFAEYNHYNNNYYGTLIFDIEKAIKSDTPGIMEIDVNGSNTLKKRYGENVVQIFIYADLKDIESRLQLRGMPDNLIKQRLEIAKNEIEISKTFQYRIENKQNGLELTISKVRNIIKGSGEERKQ